MASQKASGKFSAKIVLKKKRQCQRSLDHRHPPLIGICYKLLQYLLLCNNFNDSLTYLSFFSFKSCEPVAS